MGKMEVVIENFQKKISLNQSQIKKITQKILQHEGLCSATLSIIFVTAQKMTALNKKFLNHYYTTDVLTFDMSRSKDEMVGDIIISTDEVIKNAKLFQMTVKHELILYVIHGILHLLGYDDHKPKDIKKMRDKEQELLKLIKCVKEIKENTENRK